MNRTTAAARATRAAESKGHTLGEWAEGDDYNEVATTCTRCGHRAWALAGKTHGYGGHATIYLCRPSGKRGTLTHTNED